MAIYTHVSFVPNQGYATIGVKPAILTKLKKSTDEYCSGMFLSSALIILMNEIKRGYYSIDMHYIRADFSGRYISLTIRSDVKNRIKENYENMIDEYKRKYKTNSFTQFAGIFMLNMFESKASTQSYILKLKESDFR